MRSLLFPLSLLAACHAFRGTSAMLFVSSPLEDQTLSVGEDVPLRVQVQTCDEVAGPHPVKVYLNEEPVPDCAPMEGEDTTTPAALSEGRLECTLPTGSLPVGEYILRVEVTLDPTVDDPNCPFRGVGHTLGATLVLEVADGTGEPTDDTNEPTDDTNEPADDSGA